MSPLFKPASPAAGSAPNQRLGFVPPQGRSFAEDEFGGELPASTGFSNRVAAAGSPSDVEDRRPLRPGVIPRQYGRQPGDVVAPPPPPPLPSGLAGGLAADAGSNDITNKGLTRDFFIATQQAAVKQRDVARLKETETDERLDQMSHFPTRPTIFQLLARRRR